MPLPLGLPDGAFGKGGLMAMSARNWFGSGWLLLVMILAHALSPTASPLTKSSGSAFNGFTAEVALGPGRADPLKRQSAVLRAGSDGETQASAGYPLATLPRPPAHASAAHSPFVFVPAGSLGASAEQHPAFQARGPPTA